MEKVKYLIVGTGVSGLSFANFIGSKDYLILEKDSTPGGYCKTIIKDGFTWDYSGHFFHFRNPEIENYLLSKMPAGSIVKVKKETKILYKNKYIDFPFQKNIHQLEINEFLTCLHDLYFTQKDNLSPGNFKEMVYKNYGKGIAEAFLIPYNEKLYACDLASLDPDSMGRFFPKANIDDIIKNFKESNSNSYNDIFSYPKGGAIEYINSLLINIEKANIRYNESLVKIDPENKIAYTNNTEIKFEYLISSAPFPSLLNFLNIKADSTVFSSNKVLVFNLGFDKKGDAKNHWIYFPEKETRFYRIGYYDNIIHQDRMSLYVEIGMKTDETVDPEKELERVLQDLKKAQIITDQNLIASHHVVMNPAYVHITKGSQELFEKYSNELSSKNIYSIGRYGGWKYCSIEDNIIEAKALASSLQQKLN